MTPRTRRNLDRAYGAAVSIGGIAVFVWVVLIAANTFLAG